MGGNKCITQSLIAALLCMSTPSKAMPPAAAAVQAEYEQVVQVCRRLPPDRDRQCIEEAKKKYGELLRSRT